MHGDSTELRANEPTTRLDSPSRDESSGKDVGPQTQRAPGPDVARGVALAMVGMSNTMWWVYDSPGNLLWDSADSWTEAVNDTLITGRAYPMFSFLFGYGVVQMLGNLASRGVSRRRANIIIVRRNLTLIALGFLHALLLFSGDVLGAYGILGFICLVLARQKLSVVVLVTVAFLFFRILYEFEDWESDWYFVDVDPVDAVSYVQAMGWRVLDWSTEVTRLSYYLTPMMIGVLAARRRILEEPGKHFALLLAVIVGGFTFSITSGVPDAMDTFDLWDSASSDFYSTLESVGGIAGGLALASLCAVLAHVAGRTGRLHAVLEPLRCLGRRSLSGYLYQSCCFFVIFPSYMLGVGGKVGLTGGFVIALIVWATSLVLATILEHFGRLGPGELLMRRAAYGPRTASKSRAPVTNR